MARGKSVVLSPAEKRSAIAALKKEVKAAEGVAKDSSKAIAAAEKAHEKNLKGLTKAQEAAAKVLAGLQSKLDALQEPVAV
jgi:hypothetical protein